MKQSIEKKKTGRPLQGKSKKVKVTFTISPELLKHVDAMTGNGPRSQVIIEALTEYFETIHRAGWKEDHRLHWDTPKANCPLCREQFHKHEKHKRYIDGCGYCYLQAQP